MLSRKHSISENPYKLLCDLLLFLLLSMAITLVVAYFHTTLLYIYIYIYSHLTISAYFQVFVDSDILLYK